MNYPTEPGRLQQPQISHLPHNDLAFHTFGTVFFLAPQNASYVQLLLECWTKAEPCLCAGFTLAPAWLELGHHVLLQLWDATELRWQHWCRAHG